MKRDNEIELDPELMSPLQTLGFMLDVLRKADESANLRQSLIGSEEFVCWVNELASESKFKLAWRWKSSTNFEKSHNFTHIIEWVTDFPL